MTRTTLAIVATAGLLVLPAWASACGETDRAPGVTPSSQPDRQPTRDPSGDAKWNGCVPDSIAREHVPTSAIEPADVFQRLVQRYRDLHFYRDTARIVHVTHRGGEETSRVETAIGCELRDGGLTVQTPTSQLASNVGLDLPVQKSQAADAVGRGYDLWLAPHMTLKFADDPLKTFRSGVNEGFTPTDADHVTIDDREMLHVELRSGDGQSESCTARFDLFINPETMLVERIDGEQHMPDGARCTTSMHITPHDYEDAPARE